MRKLFHLVFLCAATILWTDVAVGAQGPNTKDALKALLSEVKSRVSWCENRNTWVATTGKGVYFEFANLQFNLTKIPLIAVDKLNGLTFKGVVDYGKDAASRIYKPQALPFRGWSKWKSIRFRNALGKPRILSMKDGKWDFERAFPSVYIVFSAHGLDLNHVDCLRVPTENHESGDLKEGVAAYYAGNYDMAYRLLNRLANQGHPRAQFRIAMMHYHGRGVAQDVDMAEALIREVLPEIREKVEEGAAWAQTNLGALYADGIVVVENDKEAVRLYRLAAEQDYPAAQTNLGVMYYCGEGVRGSHQVAISWLQRAAEHGDHIAQKNLRALGVEAEIKSAPDGSKTTSATNIMQPSWLNGDSLIGHLVPGGQRGSFQHGTYPSPGIGSDGNWTHPGVDIVARCGTSVRALDKGVVVDLIKESNEFHWNSLGYMVMLAHGSVFDNSGRLRPLYSLYLHLSKPPQLETGNRVERGQVIGTVGKTGSATGCHLHFEVRRFSDRVHPEWRNIYGRGDRRKDPTFLSDWADPDIVYARLWKVLLPGSSLDDVTLADSGRLYFGDGDEATEPVVGPNEILPGIYRINYGQIADRITISPPSPSNRYQIVRVCAPPISLCGKLFVLDRKTQSFLETFAGKYGPIEWVSWSPNERYALLVYRNEGSHQLYLVDLSTGASLSVGPWLENLDLSKSHWTEDGLLASLPTGDGKRVIVDPQDLFERRDRLVHNPLRYVLKELNVDDLDAYRKQASTAFTDRQLRGILMLRDSGGRTWKFPLMEQLRYSHSETGENAVLTENGNAIVYGTSPPWACTWPTSNA